MTANISSEILALLSKNRISTTEVSDALGKTGLIPNVSPINLGHYRVGRSKCIFTANGSNYQMHDEISNISTDVIPIVFTSNCDDKAVLGELVAKFLCLYRNAPAIIVNGCVRDLSSLRKNNYPVWCEGVTPIGCVNKEARLYDSDVAERVKSNYDDGIVICDDGGCVIIKKELITRETFDKLNNIELLEDLWFFCLDTLKWSTKEIVCDKKYLKNQHLIPSAFDPILNIMKSAQ